MWGEVGQRWAPACSPSSAPPPRLAGGANPGWIAWRRI
uniref:Uncharacterized protein n=1 Tax=Arundo donax TaxID=35708 RepID=A0A0A9BZ86_ARUDO